VDAYHNEHSTALKAVERELDTIKESMFRQSQELFKLRKEEASLVADISGTQSTARNLQGKIHDLDQRSLKQQEMLYNIEFQVPTLRRLAIFAFLFCGSFHAFFHGLGTSKTDAGTFHSHSPISLFVWLTYLIGV
jgi:hypothetical protein